jgi:hypothetical protein
VGAGTADFAGADADAELLAAAEDFAGEVGLLKRAALELGADKSEGEELTIGGAVVVATVEEFAFEFDDGLLAAGLEFPVAFLELAREEFSGLEDVEFEPAELVTRFDAAESGAAEFPERER